MLSTALQNERSLTTLTLVHVTGSYSLHEGIYLFENSTCLFSAPYQLPNTMTRHHIRVLLNPCCKYTLLLNTTLLPLSFVIL